MRTMTATQLIAAAAVCTACGKIHQPRAEGSFRTWAGPDGHAYRSRLYELTGRGSSGAIAALRLLVNEEKAR